MAKIKYWLLIAFIFFNIIQLTLTYFIPQNEESWSLKIRDMTTKRPTLDSEEEEVKLVNILKSLTEKLRKEGVIENPTTPPSVAVTNQLNGILKHLTEKLKHENIVESPIVDYDGKEIPLEQESFESDSESAEERTNKKQKLPIIIGLQKIGLTQLVLEKVKKGKNSVRTDDKPSTDNYRSFFDFDQDHQINDPFVSGIQRSDIQLDVHNFTLLLNSSDGSNFTVIKYIIIQTIPMEKKENVDPAPYIEPDPPNFVDQTLRLNDYSLKSNGNGLKLNDYSLRSDDESPRYTDDTPVIHMDTMVEDYNKIFNTNSVHNKRGTKPKSIRIVGSELPIDIELVNRRRNVKGHTPGFGISVKALNEALKKLRENGNRKRIMVAKKK